MSPQRGRKGSGGGRPSRRGGRPGGGTARPGSARSRFGFGRLATPQKRLIALVLAVALVLAFAGVALGQGLGGSSVPEGSVAEVEGVDDGTISVEEFDSAVERAAAQQGLQRTPEPGSPEYEPIRDAAMNELLLGRWLLGEAEERGIEVSEEDASEELERITTQSFGSPKEFENFVREQGYCTEEELESGAPEDCAGVRREIEVQIIAERLQEEVIGTDPQAAAAEVPESDVETFYEQNIEQFTQPETRDVRLIQNKDPEQVQDALAALQEDDSADSWKEVASEFSTDPASRDRGGLLEGVIQGQSPGGQAFDERLFSEEAAGGELVGPFEAEGGTYLLQVQNVNAEATTPLVDVSEQIRQQLGQTRQEEAATEFESDFFAKWIQRTVCAEDYITPDCGNAPPEDPCPPELEETESCGPPVTSTRPAAPGTAGVLGGPTGGGLPQGPIQPPPPQPEGVPPGGAPLPIGPGGAPPAPGAVPPGAVPPGAAPPGAVPPGAVPPGAVPPGAVPPGAVPPGAAPPPTGAPPAPPPSP